MFLVSWFSLFVGCATLPSQPPVAGGADASVATAAGMPAVSFVPLEERVNVLITDSRDADRRDRLMAARDLMETMRNKDPVAQREVYAYLDAILRIEERNTPAPIGIEPIGVPIEEETLGSLSPATPAPGVGSPLPTMSAAADPTAVVASARVALAEARYLDAVALLANVTAPDGVALRREAVDGWARTERERAGHLFLEARQLPPGQERVASLRAARSALAAINERFPENAFASQITENLLKVDAELAAAGARP